MPIEYHFDDLDLREERAHSTRPALGAVTESKTSVGCCSDACATNFC